MIIDRIVMKNFKRFRNEEIRFHDGITGILGNNGTGKSSIVQAVLFALYGVQATGISGDYIVSSFASQKEKCEVRLDFRVGGDTYAMVRSFRKGRTVQHDAELHKDGKLLATGVSPVETEIRRVLGMGPVDFRNTVYAAQKDLLTLLENTPGKRKEWFLRALGIDYLNTGSQKVLKERVDAKTGELFRLEGERDGLAARLDPDEPARLRESIAAFRESVAGFERGQADLEQERAKTEAEFRAFQEKRTEFTRLAERKRSLGAEIAGLERQRESIDRKLAEIAGHEEEYHRLEPVVAAYERKKEELESLRKTRADYERLDGERKFAARELEGLSKRAGDLREKLGILEKDAGRIREIGAGIREALDIPGTIPDPDLEHLVSARNAEVHRAIGTLSAEQKRLVSDRKKILADRETIRNAGEDGVCPLCRLRLGDHYRSIEEEFEAQLARIEADAVRAIGEHERFAAEKERLDRLAPALRELRALAAGQKNREAAERELGELSRSRKEKEEQERSIAARISLLKHDEAAFTRAEREFAELDRTRNRFNELSGKRAEGAVLRTQRESTAGQVATRQADLKATEAGIANSAFDPEAGTLLEARLAGIAAAIAEAGAGIARATERIRHAEEKIAEVEKSRARIAALEEEIAASAEEIELLKLTRSVIADYVIYLMQVVRSTIEGEVSRIVSEITGGRYEQVLLDEDFNLLVRDVDDDYAIDRFSGGEQDDIAVALRIALSRYLAGLHRVCESTFLIFDEIFGSQDEERRGNLLTALRTQESRFPQIILISHIPEIQGEFSNTLIVEMAADGSSHVREAA